MLKAQDEQIQNNSIISILEKEKKQIDTFLSNLVLAIERGIMSETTNQRLHELENRKAEIERNLLIEKNKSIAKASRNDIITYYEEALKLEPKLLINYLIKEIVLYDDKIEIFFNSPNNNNPDYDSRGCFLYSENKRIGDINIIILLLIR